VHKLFVLAKKEKRKLREAKAKEAFEVSSANFIVASNPTLMKNPVPMKKKNRRL
jgi:hypothetical protein